MSEKFHPAMIGLVGLAFAALIMAWGMGRARGHGEGRIECHRLHAQIDGTITDVRCDGERCVALNASGQVVAWWMQDGTGPTWPVEKKEPTP